MSSVPTILCSIDVDEVGPQGVQLSDDGTSWTQLSFGSDFHFVTRILGSKLSHSMFAVEVALLSLVALSAAFSTLRSTFFGWRLRGTVGRVVRISLPIRRVAGLRQRLGRGVERYDIRALTGSS